VPRPLLARDSVTPRRELGFNCAIVMSALPPKADMCGAIEDVGFGPTIWQTERPPHGGLSER